MKIENYIEKTLKGLWGTDFSDDGIPVIKTNNLTYEGWIDYSDICLRNISTEQAEDNYLKKGDLLIEKSGGTKTHSVGYVSYFEGEDNKYVCNNFILALRPKHSEIISKYLFYQMQYKYESGQFSDCFNKTTGIQNLQTKSYLGKEIKTPPLDVQKQIALNLDQVTKVIAEHKELLAKYDLLIKSRFIEMFGDIIQNDKNWDVMKLSDFSESRLGKMLDAKKNTGKESYKYLANFNVQWFHFNFEDLHNMDFSDADRVEFELKDGDLLICEGGEVGRCAVWHNQLENCYFQKALHRVRLNKNLMNPDYLSFWFKFRSDYNSFDDIVGSKATIAHLTGVKLKSLNIPVPPLELQQQFADFVQQIDKSKLVVQQSLEKCETMYKALMQEYFA